MASLTRLRSFSVNPFRRFFSGRAPLVPPVKLNRHCIYILPTRAGLGFFVMITVVLVGAMNYQNNLAYLLGFGLISLMLVTKIETYRQLLGLEISIGHIEPVFSGQTIKIPVIIKSKGQTRFAIELDKTDRHRCDDVSPPQQNVILTLPAERRGVHTLGLIRITSRFPFGLFYAWTPMPMAVNYLVYPQQEENPPKAMPLADNSAQTGSSKIGDDDFAGLKSYHPGDAPKHIHWKAYAKGQGLQSRQFSSSQQPHLWIDWDNTQGMPLEQRLSRLTAWLLAAERRGEIFGLRMPTEVVEPASDKEHLHRCLKILAVFQQEQSDD